MIKSKTLLDLPVAEGVIDSYLGELRAVVVPEDLKAFVIRWNPIWALMDIDDDNLLTPEELKLTSLDADFVELFLLLKSEIWRYDLDLYDDNQRILAHIVAPLALVKAGLLAHCQGVSHDRAMNQLYLEVLEQSFAKAV